MLNKSFEKYSTNISERKTKLKLDKTSLLQMLDNLLAHACWLWRVQIFNEGESQLKIFVSIHYIHIFVHLSSYLCPFILTFVSIHLYICIHPFHIDICIHPYIKSSMEANDNRTYLSQNIQIEWKSQI